MTPTRPQAITKEHNAEGCYVTGSVWIEAVCVDVSSSRDFHVDSLLLKCCIAVNDLKCIFSSLFEVANLFVLLLSTSLHRQCCLISLDNFFSVFWFGHYFCFLVGMSLNATWHFRESSIHFKQTSYPFIRVFFCFGR
jgi:hypothetical protein